MNKYILTREQIQVLVGKNRYAVNPDKKLLSRCIDGRYLNDKNLPALAFPGGDLGELALLAATGNAYGFEVDMKKALKTIVEVIGGVENFGIHTDHHGDPKKKASGCGHWKQMKLDPATYGLEQKNIDEIQKLIDGPRIKKANVITLDGDHLEGAVLMIKGGWGIWPRHKFNLNNGIYEAQVFVYHQSLVDERHRALCSAWLRQKAVKPYEGCDEDYLYQVLSEMAENHLMETAKRLAKGLPIYQVSFQNDGLFSLDEIGVV